MLISILQAQRRKVTT